MTLFGNVLTVGAATLASRVLGFVRDALVAAVLGSGPVADAFVVAFRLPNLFRRLFAEGAFGAAFVPTYVERRDAEGEPAALRFAGEALVGLVGAVAAASLAAVVWAGGLVDLVAPGFAADPAKRDLAVLLTRLCFPYLAAVSVVALLGGVLGASRRFLAAASAPVLLNLVLIATLAALRLVPPGDAAAGRALSLAVSVAGFAQVGLLVAACARARLMPPLRLPRRTPALRRFGRALVPGLLSGGLVEINVVVGTVIASLDAGAVAWLYYADRLYQLPLGVVGIAVGQVLLPEIAVVCAAGDETRARAVQNRALEFALALAVPAALALAVLARPIVAVLFERGAFVAADVEATAAAIAVFACGLPAFVAVKVLSPAFWGRGDTVTPMWVGAAAVAANVAIAVLLRPSLGWIAVAVSTAVAGWINAGLSWALLTRRDLAAIDPGLARRLPRILAAAGAMTALLVALRLAGADAAFAAMGGAGRAAVLAGLVAAGLAAYVVAIAGLGVVDRAGLCAALVRSTPASRDAACSAPTDRA